MPYIKKEQRQVIDDAVSDLIDAITGNTEGKEYQPNEIDGRINYAFTTVINDIVQRPKKSYFNCNRIMGVLECIKQEFYRRAVAPYEDEKIKENGDVY